MGKENREATEKAYLSIEQAKSLSPKITANITYIDQVSSMDKQPLSTKPTSPRYRLDQADKDAYEKVLFIYIYRHIYHQHIKIKYHID